MTINTHLSTVSYIYSISCVVCERYTCKIGLQIQFLSIGSIQHLLVIKYLMLIYTHLYLVDVVGN